MYHIAKSAWLALLAGVLLVSACTPKSTASPTPDASAQLTSVASTVQAELTQASALTPSATATQAVPTDTQVPPTQAAATAATAANLPIITDTPAAPPAATLAPVADKAQYVGQNIADNTKMDPGKSFTMKWTMKNIGTTTWSTKYQLRFFAGNSLGASDNNVSFPKEVKPGDEVELSVKMKAPSTAGSYRSQWVLTNADGLNFFPFYLDLVVGNAPANTSTSAPAATSTPAPAATATTAPAATATTAPAATAAP